MGKDPTSDFFKENKNMKSRIDKLRYNILKEDTLQRYYFIDDLSDRDGDLPAIVWEDGSKSWYRKGLSHRDNGLPSDIFSNGDMFWYENGDLIKKNARLK